MDEAPPFDFKDITVITEGKKTKVLGLVQEVKDFENPKKFVLKVRTDNIFRWKNESDEDYRQRRLTDSVAFIKKERDMESVVNSILKENNVNILLPREEWFIYGGFDGYPVAARIQEEVEGKTLRDYGLDNLTGAQRQILKSLLKANEICYKQTRRNLDLLGTTKEDDIGFRFKQLTLGAIRYSVNILVNNEGNLSLVDQKLGEKGGLLGAIKRIRLNMDLDQLRNMSEEGQMVSSEELIKS